MTKNGRSAGQGREGTFLNSPNKNFPSYTWIAIIDPDTSSEEGAEKFLSYLMDLEFRYNFKRNLDEMLSNKLGGIK
jgi:hypothetical protein